MKKKFLFPPLIDTNSFGTVDYDHHFITETEYSIYHHFQSLTIQKLITLHHVSNLQGALF